MFGEGVVVVHVALPYCLLKHEDAGCLTAARKKAVGLFLVRVLYSPTPDKTHSRNLPETGC